MQERRVVSFRLPAELLDWLDEYARQEGAWQSSVLKPGGSHKGKDSGKTAVIEQLLVALKEERLLVRVTAGANAFPVNEKHAGETPEYPLFVSITLTSDWS